jgi:hypothetical protein
MMIVGTNVHIAFTAFLELPGFRIFFVRNTAGRPLFIQNVVN